MATPFIGFEQFAEVQSTPPPPPSANDSTPSNGTKASKSPYDDIEPVYTGGDGDIAVLCKKLVKKDVTTKVKGLKELREICSVKPAPILRKMVPHWIHVYGRLCYDRDRRVREQLNVTLTSMLKIVPRAFSNRIDFIIGPWWVLMSDSCLEVANAAHNAFDALFGANPQQRYGKDGVLCIHLEALVQHLRLVYAFTPATMISAKLCSKSDAIEIYEQVLVSAITSVATLVNQGKEHLYKDKRLEGLLSVEVWGFLNHKDSPPLRRAAYKLLSVVSRGAALYIQDTFLLINLAPLVFEMLDELHVPNEELMWESFLGFLRASPVECWKHVNCSKSVFPKLLRLLRAGKVPQQCILPLVASLRKENTGSSKGGAARFYKDWFDAMWKAALNSKDSPEMQSAALVAIVECSLFVLLCPRDHEKPGDAAGLLNEKLASTVREFLLRAFSCFFFEHPPQCRRSQSDSLSNWFKPIAKAITNAILKLSNLRGSTDRLCVAQFCTEPIADTVWKIVEDSVLPKPRDTKIATSDHIELLLTLIISSHECTKDMHENIRNLSARALLECSKFCTNSDYNECVSVTIKILVGVLPELKLKVEKGILIATNNVTRGRNAVSACLKATLRRNETTGSRLVLVLQLVHAAILELMEISGELGFEFWSEVLMLCSARKGQETSLIELVLENATPSARDTYLRYGILLHHNSIDTIIIDNWSLDSARTASTLSFLNTCFGRTKGECNHEYTLPWWPYISKETLSCCLQQCLDRGPCLRSVDNLTLLFRCWSKSGATIAPHFEEALRACKFSIAVLLFQCYALPSGAQLVSDQWSFIQEIDPSTLVDNIAPRLRAILEKSTNAHVSVSDLHAEEWVEQVHGLDLLIESQSKNNYIARVRLFQDIGLLDTSLWKELLKVTESHPQENCGFNSRIFHFLQALIGAYDTTSFLRKLHYSTTDRTVPELLWDALVVASLMEMRSSATTSSYSKLLDTYSLVFPASVLDLMMQNEAANLDAVNHLVCKISKGDEDKDNRTDLRQNKIVDSILKIAFDELCSDTDDRKHDRLLRRLEVINGLLAFLRSHNEKMEGNQISRRISSPFDIFVGSEMWYGIKSSSGGVEYEQVKVVAVDMDDVLRYYTVRSQNGQERLPS